VMGDRKGFTLVELLVTMAVALILMAGLYQFFVSQQRSYSTQDEVLRLQQEARMAEDLMVKAIQQTGAFAPSLGTTVSLRGQVILAASDHYLTLQYDDPYRTSDKGVITAPEIVTYAVSKPSGSATERVGDDPTVAKASRTVRVYFDADGDGEVEASEAFDLAIPLALSGPPYTLYRVTPDDTGTPTFEAVAGRVENLVLRYYDHNGNPLPRDPTTGAAVDPPYVLDETERAQVRTIEIELTLRTRNEDPRYSASFVYPAGTVGTYDASGDPSSTDVTVTDGYRRRTFTTRVSPRNLSANTCGRRAGGQPGPALVPRLVHREGHGHGPVRGSRLRAGRDLFREFGVRGHPLRLHGHDQRLGRGLDHGELRGRQPGDQCLGPGRGGLPAQRAGPVHPDQRRADRVPPRSV
ncbi:MAG: prepilin-type N-terminal cleavage/methylation domain-containing protein, partial [Deltaproteobacteria bacterium]|nr:prepilin-type N-terminal cleavage/methylation domain-containing protein [Deltaproteobacteria bacterium]